LEPLQEIHPEPLRETTSADQEIWTPLYPVSMAGEHFDSSWMRIQNEHNTSSWIPFAVITAGKCVGLTCYISPEAANRCIDIGSTYYRPEFRAAW
jgi:N-acetyltransferase